MENTIIKDINKQLSLLEDAFYDGIDCQLQYHSDISNFSHQMNNIINNIRKLLNNNYISPLQPQPQPQPQPQNINYLQLDKISKLE